MNRKLLYRILVIIIGSMTAALGIDLAIHAGFGGATLAVLWVGVSETLHITIGQASFLLAAIMIVFCFFYDRKQIYIGTILNQIVYSSFTDIFAPMLRYSESKSINFLLMILGVFLFAAGTALYSYTNWGRGSYDAVMFAIAGKKGWQIKYVRACMDVCVVVLGVLLGGKFGICTICTIFISGYVIQGVLKFLRKHLPEM